MSKTVYVILAREYNYNDDSYCEEEGCSPSPQYTFDTEVEAKAEMRRMDIELMKGDHWLKLWETEYSIHEAQEKYLKALSVALGRELNVQRRFYFSSEEFWWQIFESGEARAG